MKKKLGLILVILLLSVASVSCGGQSQGQQSEEPTVLYHAISSQPYVTLDPRVCNSNGIYVLQNCYETLTRYNSKTGEVEPLLATSWTSNEDGTVWVFQIREGVKFHDGEVMDAEAVAGSIRKVVELGKGASYIWDGLESVEATGEYEVTFTMEYSAPVDLIASAGYAAYIISPNVFDQTTEYFGQGISAGTGPYKIKRVTAGEEVVLEAFEDYWGGWKEGQYKNVILKKVVESSARRQLMETGEAHIAMGFSTTDLAALRSSDKLVIRPEGTYNNVVICLNTQKHPLNNKYFRQAMAWAFPYKETVENVLEGNGIQSIGLVPRNLWGHDDSLFQYTTDLEKARECIEKSGIDPSTVNLTLTFVSGTPEYSAFGQLFQANLKQLGVNLELREMNWEAQWNLGRSTRPEDRQDMFCFIWWPDYPSPTSWFNGMVKSEEEIYFNLAYIRNPEYDRLIEEADRLTATDREAAEDLFIEIQRRMLDECEMLFLYDQVFIYVLNPEVEGFEYNPAYPTAIQYYKLTKRG
jgi:peptide/nickel transport system substrate-binding protein